MEIELFNIIEGLWWIGLGVWLFTNKNLSRIRVLLSVVLICFGMTDFVEVWSGAWWTPLWLLALKAACLAAGIILCILMYKERRLP